MKYTLRAVILSFLIVLSLSFIASAIVKSALPEATPAIADASEYFLRLENGEIVVYKDGESTDTGIAVGGLRQQDRMLLESGISADTYEDVLKLIEDFNS